jgi:uncharacterized protein (DUF433 family)
LALHFRFGDPIVQIVCLPGVWAGRPITEGTRMIVAEVFEMFAAGITEADIL